MGLELILEKEKRNKRILRRKLKWRTNLYKHAFLQSQIIGAILRPFKAGLFKVNQKHSCICINMNSTYVPTSISGGLKNSKNRPNVCKYDIRRNINDDKSNDLVSHASLVTIF